MSIMRTNSFKVSAGWRQAFTAFLSLAIVFSTGLVASAGTPDNHSVTTKKIVNYAVTSAKLHNGAVTNGKLKANSVSGSKIRNDAITAPKIKDGAVTTAKIASNAVTNAKMADDSVNTAEIVDAAVTTAKIATDAVTNAKMADDSVDTTEIVDAAVTTAKIADDAVTAAKLAESYLVLGDGYTAGDTVDTTDALSFDSTYATGGVTVETSFTTISSVMIVPSKDGYVFEIDESSFTAGSFKVKAMQGADTTGAALAEVDSTIAVTGVRYQVIGQ